MKIRPAAKPGSVTLELEAREEALLAQPSRAPIPIRKIIVPLDFSEFSYKSLDYASAFAVQSGAAILLLHIIPVNYVETEVMAFDYSQIEKQATETSRARLEKLVRCRVDPSLKTEVRVRIGRPVDEIVNAAKEFEADLIIMSTHGYTGLKHAFLGSTTENVVRYAPCPVLTLREHEHEFVATRPEKEEA